MSQNAAASSLPFIRAGFIADIGLAPVDPTAEIQILGDLLGLLSVAGLHLNGAVADILHVHKILHLASLLSFSLDS